MWIQRRSAILRNPPRAVILALVLALTTASASTARPSLQPSHASLDRQNRQARDHDFSFLSTPAEVRRFVRRGLLVAVRPSSDLELHGVSYPYARPAVREFLLRVSRAYRQACGERLVVTSLTRPRNRQPRRASRRSVHPTGMALDLRYPRHIRCRAWLEASLMHLEAAGTLEASYEGRPAHYHLAVFPRPFSIFLASSGSVSPPNEAQLANTYRVRSGDNLWNIARRHHVDLMRLRTVNRLRSNIIRPGQLLTIPSDR